MWHGDDQDTALTLWQMRVSRSSGRRGRRSWPAESSARCRRLDTTIDAILWVQDCAGKTPEQWEMQ